MALWANFMLFFPYPVAHIKSTFSLSTPAQDRTFLNAVSAADRKSNPVGII